MKLFSSALAGCCFAFAAHTYGQASGKSHFSVDAIAKIGLGANKAAVTSNCLQGIFERVGLQPNQIVLLNVQLPVALAGTQIGIESLNGGLVSDITTRTLTAPTSYNVTYPDGRRVIFNAVNNGDPYFEGPPGVRDRLQPAPGGSATQQNCYLVLPDGGKIWFIATNDGGGNGPDGGPYTTYWTFQVRGIIDPYGQTTNITPNGNGTVAIVTEPAGRMLKIFYVTGPAGDSVISQVSSWSSSTDTAANQTVTYGYALVGGYSALTSVSYPVVGSEPAATAHYTYQGSNVPTVSVPLIRSCEDPLYPGPMWRIGYFFQPNAAGVVYGQIQSENYFDGTTVLGVVTTLKVTGTSTRTEVRGDGPSRNFTYTGYQLSSFTDFKGASTGISYDAAGFPNAVNDFNGNITNFTNNSYNGAVLTHHHSADRF